jgi:polyphosphate:AMP phosphotransferase
MFESAELRHKIDERRYEKEVEKLRTDLLEAQYRLIEEPRFPLLILVNGVDGAGKGETVNLLNEWLDPRHVRSCAFGEPNEAERLRPKMWRYWLALPPKGKIGIFFGSWYTDPITGEALHPEETDLGAELARIRGFEQLLVDDGTVLVKLWFHLSKKAQKKRLTELEKSKLTRWRVTPADWKGYERYDRFRKVTEHVLRETSTGEAPWLVIDGADPRYRALTAGKAVLAALNARLEQPEARRRALPRPGATPSVLNTIDTAGILTGLTFEERLGKAKYEKQIIELQEKLGRLGRSSVMKKHAVVIVFEGMDAAGKGGTIRRITQALDARRYAVIPIAAPTDEERAQPYLWRFWRHVPPVGRVAIFDRSWYGRVLVERVEGFAPEPAWSRAYHEINEFEHRLHAGGILVIKFWLAVTKDEQMHRFKEREATKRKQFKITQEDWRNRKKWDDYIIAASDMIDRTSTSYAPWTILEANDKHLVRVRAVETVLGRLKSSS